MCLHKPSSEYFALKILSFHEVIRLNQIEHIKNEKNILLVTTIRKNKTKKTMLKFQEVRHPFLIPLLWSSTDNNHLFFLFPYICGGELFTYLRKARTFSVPTTLFYSAEIVSAFSFLHSLSITYRDLKPENILLDRDGHVVITDFGFAKKVPDRTWTLCGTPEYLAPETIQSKGHNKAVDWWALGILIYEMLVGYPPFCDENPIVIYEKILEGKIKWPRIIDTVAKDLIERLLVQDRTKRLGSMREGAEDVKNHK
jgi:protein kinase X